MSGLSSVLSIHFTFSAYFSFLNLMGGKLKLSQMAKAVLIPQLQRAHAKAKKVCLVYF